MNSQLDGGHEGTILNDHLVDNKFPNAVVVVYVFILAVLWGRLGEGVMLKVTCALKY